MVRPRIKRVKNYRTTPCRTTTQEKIHFTRMVRWCFTSVLISGGIISLALIALTLQKVTFSFPHLQVKKIQVEGCVRYTPAQIIAIADIQPQVNLLSLDLTHICQFLENSPWIEHAKVKRILPDQLSITVTERKPRALINLNQLYLIDEKGTIFKKAEKEDGVSLPILTGVNWEDLMNHHELYTSLIRQALVLMSACVETGIDLSTISEIHLDVTQGLTLFTTYQAVQIAMGYAPFPKKCTRLRAILRDLEHKNLLPLAIDLTYHTKAFVKSTPHYETIKPIKKGGESQWEKMEI